MGQRRDRQTQNNKAQSLHDRVQVPVPGAGLCITGDWMEAAATSPPLRRQILRAFRQRCYIVRDLPDPVRGRLTLWRTKAWLRKNPGSWNAQCFAHMRYQNKELEAISRLAKYRAMKARYYD